MFSSQREMTRMGVLNAYQSTRNGLAVNLSFNPNASVYAFYSGAAGGNLTLFS